MPGLFITMQGRQIPVVNTAEGDATDHVHHLSSISYSFSARLYGQRRSQREQELTRLVREPLGVDELSTAGE
ncbi:hypothetical protein [Mycobacteroides abscessus]|uniref:hypothetical protein n=1 Tax=Mycobacteroides abscessus TaxID=36809 RepID=UPI00192618C1|nr:hypothetical protein [Mycobacteroides abscessus]MBL3752916.1 hypothetical protein [Mycobacteroides abscessus subsp. massiliense]